ncbi:MAG: bifunctional folylpolyglutamate synthase/dihydrofolate synthase [Sphingobacterium sp.]|uniref:bifunctional folylpolyglutamate synthase/dihydrofolate synthase n=1 Tax=Sphingobacterium sp. JB170 TaxID=1434842 RepID=UPI00097E9398|nr:folylpolyglutamate synthase/dihydrofolate synthase family protein [Sphingobacterium sp. JB170]SJN25719.1 Dihydrofolate synthase @ Folylpolyglutamate synthase [Sphingobacterium sp. JB170]
MQTFEEIINYLYARLPMFTRDGASAFKTDIGNISRLCAALGFPHDRFKSIHVAGTNGKGSSSHSLASILSSAGFKTGLYTSPHLVDFRERVRIDGAMIPKDYVVDFVNQHLSLIESIKPSFFEVTVALAFDYFARENVDFALIEVGLGGRLDSTNIITPTLSLITNIGMDHMNMLGDTVQEIAYEKAGIIKPGVPVVVSERDERVASVFQQRAKDLDAPLRFASDELRVHTFQRTEKGLAVEIEDNVGHHAQWVMQLGGLYQLKNLIGVLTAVDQLRKQGIDISDDHIRDGLAHVVENTGIHGRWQKIGQHPLIICDTGHNEDGIREVVNNINATSYATLHVVIGAMRDKDLSHMLPQLPKDAIYYFCSPEISRALPAKELMEHAAAYDLVGCFYDSVHEAFHTAKIKAHKNDMIFVGGSNFVVAEVLT